MVRRHEMVLNFRLYVPIGTMLSEIVRIELRKCRNGSKKLKNFRLYVPIGTMVLIL